MKKGKDTNVSLMKKGKGTDISSIKENAMHVVFIITACISILCVALIFLFIFVNGVPAIGEIGPFNFLLGREWRPGRGIFGIFPFIIGSIYVTAGAILLGVPLGLLTAVFMARFCPKKVYRFLKPAISLMAGVPSVVYGFFGVVVIVPAIRSFFPHSGMSMLAASVLLSLMILPTIVNVSEAALRAVPTNYYEGALALGATHERAVFFIILPAAKSGVMTSIVLGIGRAIGETMAVIMVAGNQPLIPRTPLYGVRTLTSNIVMEMAYASDLHREALIATAVVLLVFVLMINVLLSLLKRRANH